MAASDLDHAIEADDLSEVRRLVEAGADLRHMGDYDSTPLGNAAALGRLGIVKYLLTVGTEPTYGGCSSVIVTACGRGHYEVCKVLLEAGVSPDETDEDEDDNCVNMAIFKARLNILELLFDHGADLEPLEEYIEYAAELNFDGSHYEIIAYLTELK